jgi:hypothetical protein
MHVWISFLFDQPIMLKMFMTSCPAHLMTPPPPSSTHMFTESSIQGLVLPPRMGLHALTEPLSPPPKPRPQVLVDPHPHQRQHQTQHQEKCDSRLRVTTLVEVYHPSMGLFHHPWRNRTLTLSYSRSSDISRARRQARCTRRALQSFITS